MNKQTEAEQYCPVHRSNGPQPIGAMWEHRPGATRPSYFLTKPKLNFFHKKIPNSRNCTSHIKSVSGLQETVNL